MIVAVVGCTGNVPPTREPTQQPEVTLDRAHGVPGEGIEYRVTLRGVGVGKVQVGVGKLGWIDGREALIVKSRGQTEGLIAVVSELTWELTTTIDLERARPIRNVADARITLVGEEPEDAHEEHEWSDGDRGHDLHSATAVIRGWRSKPGERTELRVAIDSMRLDVKLWHAKTELVTVKRTLAAVRYDGIAEDKYRFSVWLSDDVARVPLRLRTQSKWGEIMIEMVHYEAPLE